MIVNYTTRVRTVTPMPMDSGARPRGEPVLRGYLWRGQPGLAAVNAQIMRERQQQTSWPPGTAPHGTMAAHRRHQRAGQKPCEDCRQAQSRAIADRARRQRELGQHRRR